MANRIVYLISVSGNPVKIGLATNLASRLESIQTGCPDTITLHRHWVLAGRQATEVEAKSHLALAEHHRRGEWFNVSAEVAEETINAVIEAAYRQKVYALSKPNRVIERLSQVHAPHYMAGAAVNFYRTIRIGTDAHRQCRPYHLAMDGAAGQGGTELVELIVIKGRRIEDVAAMTGRTVADIELRLTRALNGLAEMYAGMDAPAYA